MRSVLTALCLFATTAHAVPAQFTHQGRLLDADALPMDGEATITFRLITEETGGVIVWEEALTVPLTNGFYSAVLGANEEDNPLDTEALAQAPIWLELQLDGEPAMFPRNPVNSVPYATMATVAEEVSGGPVDASEIAVAGSPVINDAGEWVGPAPTVNWADIEDIPEGFIDGIDDDTDTDTDSFADLAISCVDGDIPVWDGVVGEWVCDFDQDTLAEIECLDGQLIQWSADSTGWVCADDIDTVLSEDDVDDMVADNGYAMASEIFSGSFLDLVDVAPGLADGDDDTQLTAEEVDAIVADNGYAMATDVFSGSFADLSDIPADADTLSSMTCTDGQTVAFDSITEAWVCTDFSDSTLSSDEVRDFVSDSAINLAAESTVDGASIVTQTEDGRVGIGTSEPTSALDVEGSVTHQGVVLTEGSNIDQTYTTDVTMRLTSAYQDTGIEGDDLTNGTYIVRLWVNDHAEGGGHYSMAYSGIMNWFGGGTNGTETKQIELHHSGHAKGGKTITLQTKHTLYAPGDPGFLRLQIRVSPGDNPSPATYSFQFRRLL